MTSNPRGRRIAPHAQLVELRAFVSALGAADTMVAIDVRDFAAHPFSKAIKTDFTAGFLYGLQRRWQEFEKAW